MLFFLIFHYELQYELIIIIKTEKTHNLILVMEMLLMLCVLVKNSLAEPIPLQVYNQLEFSFPSRLVAIPRLRAQSELQFTHS